MKSNLYDSAKRVLDNYIEQNKCRKTRERYAVLEAVYGFGAYFSIQELSERLAEANFPVCRATLYNTIKLLMSLHLVVSLRREDGVRYKACYADNRCVQVCTICGKAKDVKAAEVVDAFANLRLKRFRKEGFSMYIYGICSTCQARLTRQKKKESSSKQE